MNHSALLTLIITIVSAALFISERLRPDLVALLVMITLGLSGLVPGDQVFAGFSGSAVITILGISIISVSLHQTGITNQLGRMIHKIGQEKEREVILLVMLLSTALSLFMNNIATVGILLPAVMTASRKTRIRPSLMMMPLAYGSILGGMATLLTTSNIIVSSALRDSGYQPYGLLDFLPIGLPLIVIGIAYMLTIGRSYLKTRITPSLANTHIKDSLELFSLYKLDRELYEIEILDGSPLANKGITDSNWGQTVGVNILGVKRGNQVFSGVLGNLILKPGDHLYVHGGYDVEIFDYFLLNLVPPEFEEGYVSSQSTGIVEIIISPHSNFIGKTLKELKFREKFNLNVLALWRGNDAIKCDLPNMELQGGDALLVQGSASQIRLIKEIPDIVLLEEDPDAVVNPQKQSLSLLITLITLLVASLGVFPIALVIMTGAVALILSKSLTMNDVFEKVEWKVIFLIAGMWPLSTAIRTSGLSDGIVQLLFTTFGNTTPLFFAAILILLTFFLTHSMSGQVSALVLAPIALSAAEIMGVDPRSMGMAVALGCSLAFATPFGHPVNIIVMSPGGYSIKDYLKLGLPLTVLIYFAILVGLKIFWNL